MESLEEFEAKTMLAFDLQPQEGEYAFLPGKGWGTEIAIQYPVYKKTPNGLVERKKDPTCFEARGYRTHSDFELYGTVDAKGHYTPAFLRRFGAQEVFETTKMDRDSTLLTRDELWNNTEITVLPNGRQITTLAVEYLLADKLIQDPNFNHPGFHGRNVSDAGALALVYEDIDRAKVKELYTRHIEAKAQATLKKLPKDAVAFITDPLRPVPDIVKPSRFDTVVHEMENLNSIGIAPSEKGRPDILLHVSLLRGEDYIPLVRIHNDPSSWQDGKLTDKAKEAIKEAMIKSTKESIKVKLEEIQQQVQNVDKFFSDVDHRKQMIREKAARKNAPQRQFSGLSDLLAKRSVALDVASEVSEIEPSKRKKVIDNALKGTRDLKGKEKREAELTILRKTNVQDLRDAEGKARGRKLAEMLKEKYKNSGK